MDYETEYNNRARVPEHPQIIAGWNSDAAAYRGTATCELDLAYGDGERQKLDLFHPHDGDHDAPLALFIHGGYWQGMDRKVFSGLAHGLNSHGVTVAMPSYDLCPDVGIGEIIEQMRSCCRWLWDRYERPVTVFGHSAGGHLTAVLVATDWPKWQASLPADLCTVGYAISGLFELASLIGTSINDAVGLDAETAEKFSPLDWPTAHAQHLTAAVGGLESSEFLRQSKTVCDVWKRKGVETAYREIDGTDHFTVIADLADPDSAMVHDILALIDLQTPRGP